MAFVEYFGTKLNTAVIVSVSPVIESKKDLSHISYYFQVTTTHSVINSPSYPTETDAESARTAFLSLIGA